MIKLALAFVAALSVLLWRFFALDPNTAGRLQQNFGFWMMLGVFGAWVVLSLRDLWPVLGQWRVWSRRHGICIGLVILGGLWLHFHEPHDFKILHDEPTHVATAMLMHETGQTGAPAGLHYFEGGAQYPTIVPAVRMYFFSALLAAVHGMTGYRVENVFWLNGALGIALGLLMYAVAARFSGRRGGLLAVALLYGLPLLAQNVTCAGYDVLNLVLILAFLVAVLRYLRRPGVEGLDVMLLAGILLAYCRYESILYLLLAVAAAAWKWRTEKRVTLTWGAVFSPLALWPCFTANLIMLSNEAFTLPGLRQQGFGFFDVRFWADNAAKAVFYVFDYDRDSTNSILLSWVGGASILIFFTGVIGRAIKKRSAPDATGRLWTAIFAAYALGIYAFVLTHFWGMPTQSSATRFILPAMMMFALAVPLAWREVRSKLPVPLAGIVVAAAFALLVSGGISSRAYQTNNMVFPQAYAWFLKQAEARGDRQQTLYIAPSSLYLAMHKFPSMPTEALRRGLEKAEMSLEAGLYREILILDIRWRDPLTSRWARLTSSTMPEGGKFEVLETYPLPHEHQAQLLRLVLRPRKEDDPQHGVERPPLRTTFTDPVERAAYFYSLLP